MKETVQQAAEKHAAQFKHQVSAEGLENIKSDFLAGHAYAGEPCKDCAGSGIFMASYDTGVEIEPCACKSAQEQKSIRVAIDNIIKYSKPSDAAEPYKSVQNLFQELEKSAKEAGLNKSTVRIALKCIAALSECEGSRNVAKEALASLPSKPDAVESEAVAEDELFEDIGNVLNEINNENRGALSIARMLLEKYSITPKNKKS